MKIINFIKNHFLKKKVFKIIHSLIISNQILEDKDATIYQLGIPIKYEFNIDTKKCLRYRNYSIGDLILYTKNISFGFSFECENISYYGKIEIKKDNVHVFVWINQQDI